MNGGGVICKHWGLEIQAAPPVPSLPVSTALPFRLPPANCSCVAQTGYDCGPISMFWNAALRYCRRLVARFDQEQIDKFDEATDPAISAPTSGLYGVVLYEMLTGKQAFAEGTVSDTLAAVLRAEPQWDAIPVGMRRLVRRCLEKNPKRRLRDIGEARVVIEDGNPAVAAARRKCHCSAVARCFVIRALSWA